MTNQKISINIVLFFISLILLLQVKVFYLLPFDAFYSINSNQQQILMVLVLIIGLTTLNFRPIIEERNGIFSKSIFIFIIYYIFELIYSSIKNGQGLADAFVSSNFYLMVLFYYMLSYYFKKYGVKYFFKSVIVISLLNILACWGQYILAQRGIVVLHMSLGSIRFGSIRIYDMGETVTCFGILLSYAEYLNSKSNKKWKLLLVIILGIAGNLIVSKGRITILAIAVGMVAITLARFRKNSLKTIAGVIVIAIAIAIFFQTSVGKTYFNSLSDSSMDTGAVRLREMSYYNAQTTSSISNFLVGVGFIRDNGDSISNYLKGPVHQYSRTDVGIFGLANALGIIGVAWYLFQIIKCIYYIVVSRRRSSNVLLCVLTGLLMFNIVYIPTMVTFNPFSITTFTILLALVEYNSRSIMEKNNVVYQ